MSARWWRDKERDPNKMSSLLHRRAKITYPVASKGLTENVCMHILDVIIITLQSSIPNGRES